MLFLYILKNAIRAEQIESCAASYPYQNAPQNVFVLLSAVIARMSTNRKQTTGRLRAHILEFASFWPSGEKPTSCEGHPCFG